MKSPMPGFADLADLSEDARIAIIGVTAARGALVGFVVETDDKADRYVEKLLAGYRVRVIDRMAGPVPATVLVRVGPAES